MIDCTFEVNDCTATKYKNCGAGDCMAWVWYMEKSGETKEYGELKAEILKPSKTDGFCIRLKND